MFIPQLRTWGTRRLEALNVLLDLLEEFPHSWSGGGVAGEFCYAEALEHEAEDALVLV
jgi:hypothetical protein